MKTERNYLQIFIIFLILVFPTLCNQTKHAGSIVLVLLTVIGLPICFSRTRRPLLSDEEKWVMWAFASYFIVYLICFGLNYLLGNLADPRTKHLDHEHRMLYFIPIFFLLRRIQLPQWALWYSAISGAAVFGVFALVEKFILQSSGRISGSYHAIAYGDLSVVAAFISLAAVPFFRKKHPAGILIPISAFFLGISAVLLSGTRGAWIAIPGLMIIAALHLRKHFKPRTFLIITVSVGLLATAAYHIPETEIAERFHKAVNELSNYYHGSRKYSSSGARFEGWRAGWIIFRENLLIGGGPGNFQPIVLEKIAKGEVSKTIAIHSQPHSAYFSAMADCGIPGLLAIFGLFTVPLGVFVSRIKQDRADRNVCYAGLILIIGFMHFGLTETIFGRNVYVSFYVAMTAAVLAVASGTGSPPSYASESPISSQ